MVGVPFWEDEDCRLLTVEAFDFMFEHELKCAIRSQTYVTLLSIDARVVSAGDRQPWTRAVARLTSRQVRETDLLSHHDGRLLIVLHDADLQNSLTVVDRVMSRFEEHEFSPPATFIVGAACCPTHGTDAEQLRRAAQAQQVHPSRDSSGVPPNSL